ncbi:hypothetical protein [Paracoccus jiaweipingae]|uniref:hypothetical protein n=1 Tax=unclassified Paracoccus (in: a-proteobacteria) TaxID=2688777 RepID=UPI0037A81326
MNRLATALVVLAVLAGGIWWVTGGDLAALRGVTRDRVESSGGPTDAPLTPQPDAPATAPQPDPADTATADRGAPAPDPAIAADRAAEAASDDAARAEAAADAAIRAADAAVAAAEEAAQAPLPPVALPEAGPDAALPPATTAPPAPPHDSPPLPAETTVPAPDAAGEHSPARDDPALTPDGFNPDRVKALIAQSTLSDAQKATLTSLTDSAAGNPALRRAALEQIRASLP